ncbi:hypothetical protein C8J56DRAFT_900216 [Mycena floridula]|nr:hypothetical protein C8J56DRAFT_900216 [Mycena floridula]
MGYHAAAHSAACLTAGSRIRNNGEGGESVWAKSLNRGENYQYQSLIGRENLSILVGQRTSHGFSSSSAFALMNRFSSQVNCPTAESKALEDAAYQQYLDRYFEEKRRCAKDEGEQRDWIQRRHRLFYQAYRTNELPVFWEHLAEAFNSRFREPVAVIGSKISLARYLAEVLYDYMVDENIWAAEGISLDEAAEKCLAHLDDGL